MYSTILWYCWFYDTTVFTCYFNQFSHQFFNLTTMVPQDPVYTDFQENIHYEIFMNLNTLPRKKKKKKELCSIIVMSILCLFSHLSKIMSIMSGLIQSAMDKGLDHSTRNYYSTEDREMFRHQSQKIVFYVCLHYFCQMDIFFSHVC